MEVEVEVEEVLQALKEEEEKLQKWKIYNWSVVEY